MSKSKCNKKYVMEKVPYIANVNICQHPKLYFTYKINSYSTWNVGYG